MGDLSLKIALLFTLELQFSTILPGFVLQSHWAAFLLNDWLLLMQELWLVVCPRVWYVITLMLLSWRIFTFRRTSTAAVILHWGCLTSTLSFNLWSFIRGDIFRQLFIRFIIVHSFSWHPWSRWGNLFSPLFFWELQDLGNSLTHSLTKLGKHLSLLFAEVDKLFLHWHSMATFASIGLPSAVYLMLVP